MGMEAIQAGARLALQAHQIANQRKRLEGYEKITEAQIEQMQAQAAQREYEQQQAKQKKEATQKAFIRSRKKSGQPTMQGYAQNVLQEAGPYLQPNVALGYMQIAGKPTPEETFQRDIYKEMVKNQMATPSSAWDWFFKTNPQPKREDVLAFKRGLEKPTSDKLRELDIVARAVGISPNKLRGGELTQEEAAALSKELMRRRKYSILGAILGLQGQATPAMPTEEDLDSIIE